jgi:SAM-dependent methyltransferase
VTNSYRPIQARTNRAVRAVASNSISNLESFFLRVFDSVQGRIFDRLLAVSTRGIVVTDGCNFVAGGDNCAYASCQWLPVHRALKDLEPTPSDVFVDLGSGKGKALLIAGRLPYQRVIGVEIDDDLSQYARRNIKLAQQRLRAQELDSITASASEWPFPDEMSVVFMYNPFVGQTFRKVVHRVFESYDRNPRNLYIVYGFPWEHDWLLSTGRVVVDSVRPNTWPARLRWWQSGDVIVSYRVVGVGEERGSDSLPHRWMGSHRAAQRWSAPNGHRFIMGAPGQKTLYSRP